MKLCKGFFICAMVAFAAISGFTQGRAVLRKDGEKYRVDVTINAMADPNQPVIAALYAIDDTGARKQLKKFQQPVPASTQSAFSIEFPDPPAEKVSHVVSVFEFPTTGGVFNYDLPVGRVVTGKLLPQDLTCPNGIIVDLKSSVYVESDWQKIIDWVNLSGDGVAKVTTRVADNPPRDLPVRSVKVLTSPKVAAAAERMLVCLRVQPTLPTADFSATVSFINAPEQDLQKPLVEAAIKAVELPKVGTSADDNGLPGKRGLERNLDLGISFTSSVGEKTADDGSKFIGRTSRGVFDIRLAPLLKIKGNQAFDRDQRQYRFWTPFFLDAAVSTGEIDKDTLSMNRVIFGTEYEWRFYDFKKRSGTNDTILDPYVTHHRIIVRGTHASDRDFKQREFLATIEYQPVVGALNHPINLNWTEENGIRVPNDLGFGYQIIPRFGYTIGKTYFRDDPAPVIEPSETANRFHIGLDLTFDFTRYVQLSVTDTLYIRGEAPDDRTHNYFKGTIEAPIGSPFAKTVNSLFVSFERGQQPPFATRDVNVFKVGYRIRSEGWWGRFR